MLGRGVVVALALGAMGASAAAASVTASVAHASHQATAMLDGSSAGTATYHGLTSQHEPITFTLARGQVRGLSFAVIITCPSHRRYRLRASGFDAIGVHAGRFATTVTSKQPSARATVSGRVGARRITGRVSLRRYVAAEHAACAGAASFALTR